MYTTLFISLNFQIQYCLHKDLPFNQYLIPFQEKTLSNANNDIIIFCPFHLNADH